MKRLFGLSLAALVCLVPSSWAGGPCLNHGIHCMVPEPYCPDCSCPCAKRLHFCSKWKSEKAHALINQLCSGDCCDRIHAAEKLGSRLHADFCCDPEVLHALIAALQCDPCWEVRRAAAWSIALQGARTGPGVLALYVAAKLDPHFLVRDRAAEALDILLVCRKDCFKELFKSGDSLIKELKKAKYKPGSENCRVIFDGCCASLEVLPTAPAPKKGPVTP